MRRDKSASLQTDGVWIIIHLVETRHGTSLPHFNDGVEGAIPIQNKFPCVKFLPFPKTKKEHAKCFGVPFRPSMRKPGQGSEISVYAIFALRSEFTVAMFNKGKMKDFSILLEHIVWKKQQRIYLLFQLLYPRN